MTNYFMNNQGDCIRLAVTTDQGEDDDEEISNIFGVFLVLIFIIYW